MSKASSPHNHASHTGHAHDTLLPFDFPAIERKKGIAAFDGGRISSDAAVVLLSAIERSIVIHVTVVPRDGAHGAGGREQCVQPGLLFYRIADIARASGTPTSRSEQRYSRGLKSVGSLRFGARSKGMADHTFVSPNRHLDLGTQIVAAGFLPGHAAVVRRSFADCRRAVPKRSWRSIGHRAAPPPVAR